MTQNKTKQNKTRRFFFSCTSMKKKKNKRERSSEEDVLPVQVVFFGDHVKGVKIRWNTTLFKEEKTTTTFLRFKKQYHPFPILVCHTSKIYVAYIGNIEYLNLDEEERNIASKSDNHQQA
jgi:hypothetical protein